MQTVVVVQCHNQVHKFDAPRNTFHLRFIQLVDVKLDEQIACEAFEGIVSE